MTERFFLNVYRPFNKSKKLITVWFTEVLETYTGIKGVYSAYFQYSSFKGENIEFIFFIKGNSDVSEKLESSIRVFISTQLEPLRVSEKIPKLDKLFMDYPINSILTSQKMENIVLSEEEIDHTLNFTKFILRVHSDTIFEPDEFKISIPSQLLLLQLFAYCQSKLEILSFIGELSNKVNNLNNNDDFSLVNHTHLDLVREDFDDLTKTYWGSCSSNRNDLLSIWYDISVIKRSINHENFDERKKLFTGRFKRMFFSMNQDENDLLFVVELVKKYVDTCNIL